MKKGVLEQAPLGEGGATSNSFTKTAAADTAVTITFTPADAQTAVRIWAIQGCYRSTGTLANGGILIQANETDYLYAAIGTKFLTEKLVFGGPGLLFNFNVPVTITLSAGGTDVIGQLTIQHDGDVTPT